MRVVRNGTVLMLCALAVYARKPGDPIKPGFNLMSKQQDIQLGQEAAAEVRKQKPVVQNAFLQDYVKQIGNRLAGTDEARSSGFAFSFTLIVDPSINAFALPGGPMFINSGLLPAVDSEAQLAGVMAHEMSHVILRHGTHQVSKANAISLPAALAGAVLGGSGSMLGQLAKAGIGLGANSVILKFSRDAESEADALGARLMAEAGWNPVELANFFETLERRGAGRTLQLLSDHPNPGNRRQAIEAEIQTFPRSRYDYNTGLFPRAKAEIARLPSGPSAGPIRGDTPIPSGAVSGSPRTYQGQNFSIQYPGNWQALGGDQANGVTLAPREGLVAAANGSTQVGLGAIASYFFPEGPRTDLKTATDDLIHHLRQGNPNLEVTGSARRIQVDGREALWIPMESGSPFGGTETDQLITADTPEGLFYLVFIAPKTQFGALKAAMDGMVASVRLRS